MARCCDNLDKWWYVGNTPAISRLGIPSLNMQDAAGGFRPYWNELTGTVTCWPSLLSMAATFDDDLVHTFAVALGEEFRGKGANVILGPSINVHRVARNGRNFEYLSGEDPYLGARLVKQYVNGVQSNKVATVMKHYALNHQETQRNSYSSSADLKTMKELYMPPYMAAIEAGVSAVMCSYNLVDGAHACASSELLNGELKGDGHFQGFVQSDWGATHSTSVTSGLDMDMPMAPDGYFDPSALSAVAPSAINASAKRIVAVMYRMDMFTNTKCAPPNCETYLRTNVSTAAHQQIARDGATASVVLLKNDNATLPISHEYVSTIAVVGAAAVGAIFNPTSGQGHGGWNTGDYYSGGGSGHVAAGYVVTPLAGITAAAHAAGITVVSSTSNDASAAAAVAATADLTIVLAATTSGEAMDRSSLALDDNADSLISTVVGAAKKTIVLVQTPGAFTSPWRNDVDAIATMFLGGQMTGLAWGDILFGVVAPSGRLPIMLPASESDAIAVTSSTTIRYTEGLATSYRASSFTAAYPFGHGLTYATFTYGTPTVATCGALPCVQMSVTHDGGAASMCATATPQVYLEFPQAAAQVAPVLKGFVKTRRLCAGQSQQVTFEFTQRDFSYYDAATRAWVQVAKVTAHVGASSADIKHSIPLPTAVEIEAVPFQ